MKTIFALILGIFLAIGASPVYATVLGWDLSGNVFKPLPNAWTAAVNVPSINATSTTATSTFAGVVTVGTSTTGRLNVGGPFANESGSLRVNGAVFSSDSFSIPGLTTLSANSLYSSGGFNLKGYNGTSQVNLLNVHSDGTTNIGVNFPTGNVGIGTTTPSRDLSVTSDFGLNRPDTNQEVLSIAAGSNGVDFTIKNSNGRFVYVNGTTEVMRLSGANLGIGTNVPDVKLHIQDGNTNITELSNTYGLFGNVSAVSDDVRVGLIAGTQGSTFLDFGATSTLNDGGFEYDNLTNKLGIFASSSERMSILGSGNVGIGTTTPSSKLDVSGKLKMFDTTPTGADSTTKMGYLFNNNSPAGSIIETVGTEDILSYGINVSQFGTRNTAKVGGIFRFDTRAAEQKFTVLSSPTGGSTSNERLSVNLQTGAMSMAATGGNVAVGTTTASAKLSIQNTFASQVPLFDVTSSTNAAGSATTSLFKVLANGNVGIGTSSPLYSLVVQGTMGGINLKRTIGGSLNAAFLLFENALNTGFQMRTLEDATDGVRITNKAASTDYLNILSTGNVGIASSTPAARLSVTGASSGIIMQIVSDAGTKFMEMLNTGVTALLGAWDFGGATSVEIPNGTAGVVDAIAEINFDTTDNQLLIASSTDANAPIVIPGTVSLGSFLVSSTTQPFLGTGFVTGKAIPFKINRDGYKVTEIHCDIDGGTSIVINFDNGTGNTSTLTCDTDGASLIGVGANAVVTAGLMTTAIETGTVTGVPDYLRVSVFGTWIRE